MLICMQISPNQTVSIHFGIKEFICLNQTATNTNSKQDGFFQPDIATSCPTCGYNHLRSNKWHKIKWGRRKRNNSSSSSSKWNWHFLLKCSAVADQCNFSQWDSTCQQEIPPPPHHHHLLLLISPPNWAAVAVGEGVAAVVVGTVLPLSPHRRPLFPPSVRPFPLVRAVIPAAPAMVVAPSVVTFSAPSNGVASFSAILTLMITLVRITVKGLLRFAQWKHYTFFEMFNLDVLFVESFTSW